MKSLEVLFAPAEFAALKNRDLSDTVCVVFDILRATSTIVAALGNGATGVAPVEEIAEAIAFRQNHPDALLAGEREGVRIQFGGVTFDLGNSPREFIPARVLDRLIVTTTTNGTRALRACSHARLVLAASFLNRRATTDFLNLENPARLLLVCSGTHEEAAYEDVLGAGALCDLVKFSNDAMADSALLARKLWRQEKSNLLAAVSESRNARRLLAMPELRDDVAWCFQRDVFPIVAQLHPDCLVKRR
jgi:2-phosphosulfolactate phosphatase